MFCVHKYTLINYPFNYIYAGLFGVGCVLVTSPNIVAVLVLFHKKNRSKDSSKLLISLSIYDLLVGLICLPMHMWLGIHSIEATPLACLVSHIALPPSVITVIGSWVTICIISYHRYLCIRHKHAATNLLSTRRIYISMGITFLGSVGAYVMTKVKFVLTLSVIYLSYFVGLFSLITFYGLIIREIKKSRKELQSFSSNENDPQEKLKVQREIRLSKKVTKLILAYGICMTPTILWALAISIDDNQFTKYVHLYQVARILAFLNSAINPPIYLNLSETKKILKKTFTCKNNNS